MNQAIQEALDNNHIYEIPNTSSYTNLANPMKYSKGEDQRSSWPIYSYFDYKKYQSSSNGYVSDISNKLKEMVVDPTITLLIEGSQKGDGYIKTPWGVYIHKNPGQLCDGNTKQNRETFVAKMLENRSNFGSVEDKEAIQKGVQIGAKQYKMVEGKIQSFIAKDKKHDEYILNHPFTGDEIQSNIINAGFEKEEEMFAQEVEQSEAEQDDLVDHVQLAIDATNNAIPVEVEPPVLELDEQRILRVEAPTAEAQVVETPVYQQTMIPDLPIAKTGSPKFNLGNYEDQKPANETPIIWIEVSEDMKKLN